MKNCGQCRFMWIIVDSGGEVTYECRRYAPRVWATAEKDPPAVWPKTTKMEGCGEYARASEADICYAEMKLQEALRSTKP